MTPRNARATDCASTRAALSRSGEGHAGLVNRARAAYGRTVQICMGTETKTGEIDTAIIGGAHVRLIAVLASSSRLALPVIISGLAAKTDPRNLVEAIAVPLRSTLPHHH